jgi:hypothetical protein
MRERVTAIIELIIESKFVLSVGKDLREAVIDRSTGLPTESCLLTLLSSGSKSLSRDAAAGIW